MATLYYVGPKGKDNGKPWLMTGNEKVARDYAQAMDGEVRTKEIVSPRIALPFYRRE